MRALPILLVAVIGTPAAAQDNSVHGSGPAPASAVSGVEISTGLEYEEGDYGTGEKIRRLSVPAAVRIAAGRLEVAATVPYTRIDGPGNVVAGGGLLGLPIIVDPTKPSARTRRDGIGDVSVGASYRLSTPIADVKTSAEVKLPTASRELGTGKTDYAVGLQASKTIGSITPFAGVSYTMPGDPDGFALRNSLSVSGGIAARLGKETQGFVSYSHGQNANKSLPDEQQVSLGVNTPLADGLSLGAYGAAGLSDGSPDASAGIRLGLRIR